MSCCITRGDMNFQKTALQDIARPLGMAEQTVANVVNCKPVMKEGSRVRLLEACARMGYRANALAHSLKTSQSSLISLVMPNITTSKYSEITQTVTMVAAQKDFRLSLRCQTEVPNAKRSR